MKEISTCKTLAGMRQGTRQVMQFLKTGRFEWTLPLGQSIVYQHPTGRPGLDYIGINCVCDIELCCTPVTTCAPHTVHAPGGQLFPHTDDEATQ